MRDAEIGPDDAELTAFLDGALPPAVKAVLEARLTSTPELRQRLELLAEGERPFREAFARLGDDAVRQRLAQRLSAAVAARPPRPRSWGLRALPANLLRPAAIAAGLALFLAGAGAGYVSSKFFPTTESTENAAGPEAWREVVAEYLSLTTSQTLLALRSDPADLKADLASVGKTVKLDLSPERLALPGQELRRIELYHFDNAPLVEIAYLDPENGPMAFCVMARAGQSPEGIELEERQGMNIAYWSSPTHSFMLVGRAPRDVLETVAHKLSGQLAS